MGAAELMSLPLISVVMPVFNGERFLPEAIESVLNQSYRNIELILINDGSHDRSLEIMRDFSERDPRIFIINGENRGLVASLNEGIERSRGCYIARMDADDICLPERLALQFEHFRRFPETGVLGTRTLVIDESGHMVGRCRRPLAHSHIVTYLLYGCPFAHPSVMFNLNQIPKSSLVYREAAHPVEDLELWLRLSEHHVFANVEQPLLKYRLTGSGICGQNATLQGTRGYELRQAFFRDDAYILDLLSAIHSDPKKRPLIHLLRSTCAAVSAGRIRSPAYLFSILIRVYTQSFRMMGRG